MTLHSQLAALGRSRQTPAMEAARAELLTRLDAARVAAGVLKPGEAMPGFLLPNAEGALIASAELLARGPVVVAFVRGDWCPYCEATMRALAAALPGIEAGGGTLLVLTPETGGRALRAKRARRLRYEVLVDVDLAVAMRFGVVFRVPPLYADLLRQGGIDLAARSGNPGWFLPIPATFLVDEGGLVRRRWVEADFARRAEPAEIVLALRELRREAR